METHPYRLAAVTSHPVQYQAPLFQRLAAQQDIHLTVYYGHDDSVAGALDQGFGVHVRWDRPLLDGYKSVFLRRRSHGRLGAVRRLTADARIILHLWRQRFDAVLIHSYATRLSLFAYLGALVSGTPVLLRTESGRLRAPGFWRDALRQLALRPLFAVTSGFLVIGRANRAFFGAYGVSQSRQFFTPYSVDNEFFSEQRREVQASRHALRRSHGWTDDVVVVGFTGKLVPGKDISTLIDAIANLQEGGLRVGLFLVGAGQAVETLERQVHARAVKWTVFAGFKNQTELAACYICMDVFVLPSRSETWGLVLNEAMLFGLPVLATNAVGATRDLVEEGENGYVFDVGDVGGLAQHLRHLVGSAETRRRFGTRSETVVGRYSYEVCVTGIHDALVHTSRTPRRRPTITVPDNPEP